MTDLINRADVLALLKSAHEADEIERNTKAYPMLSDLEELADEIRALPAAQVAVSDDTLRQAIGRAWCHDENSAKEMDVTLAESVLWEIRATLTVDAIATPDHAVNADSRQPTLADAMLVPEVQALVDAVKGLQVIDIDKDEAIVRVYDLRRLRAALAEPKGGAA